MAVFEDLMSKPAYLFVRFRSEAIQVCRNQLFMAQSSLRTSKGKVLGIASQVEVLEGPWPHDTGVAVLYFPTVLAAIRWQESTHQVKQPDWIHSGAEILILPLSTAPSKKKVLVLQDARIKQNDQKQKYNAVYLASLKSQTHSQKMALCVVRSESKVKVRGSWETDQAVLHQFESKQDYFTWRESDEYKSCREQLLPLSAYITTTLMELQDLK